jgi:hypothetical protein
MGTFLLPTCACCASPFTTTRVHRHGYVFSKRQCKWQQLVAINASDECGRRDCDTVQDGHWCRKLFVVFKRPRADLRSYRVDDFFVT